MDFEDRDAAGIQKSETNTVVPSSHGLLLRTPAQIKQYLGGMFAFATKGKQRGTPTASSATVVALQESISSEQGGLG